MNDTTRKDWINNDEALYLHWKSSGLGITAYTHKYRAELTAYIGAMLAMGPNDPRPTYKPLGE